MLYILVVGLILVVFLPLYKTKKAPPPTVNKNPYNIKIEESAIKKKEERIIVKVSRNRKLINK